MGMSKQRKVTLGLIGSSLIGLAIQEGLLLGNAAPASAAGPEPAAGTANEAQAEQAAQSSNEAVAAMLEAFAERRQQSPDASLSVRPDGAFTTPKAWRTTTEREKAGNPAVDTARIRSGLRVSSVMESGDRGYAVINGQIVGEGEILEGVGKVIKVTPTEIRMLIQGQVVALEVREPASP